MAPATDRSTTKISGPLGQSRWKEEATTKTQMQPLLVKGQEVSDSEIHCHEGETSQKRKKPNRQELRCSFRISSTSTVMLKG